MSMMIHRHMKRVAEKEKSATTSAKKEVKDKSVKKSDKPKKEQ